MKELLFFIGGNILSLLYFTHLYFQLICLQKCRKPLLHAIFFLRFLFLGAALGTICFFFPEMTLYLLAGLLSAKVAILYLVKQKWK